MKKTLNNRDLLLVQLCELEEMYELQKLKEKETKEVVNNEM